MSHAISYEKVEVAIQALKKGGVVLLVDDEDRENEGDFVACGSLMGEKELHLMIQRGSGIVCLAMTEADSQRLGIDPMVSRNACAQQTPFGVSFEAATGLTTGVSVQDRMRSIAVASDPKCSSKDIVMPGHVFPLIAKDGGIFERAGHTEGSVDLMKLAHLPTCAAICEVMSADGTMARFPELQLLAKSLDIPILSIKDIERYRTRYQSWVQPTNTIALPTEDYGELSMTVFEDTIAKSEYTVLHRPWQASAPLLRIHSQCFTGDVLGSRRCDCGSQLAIALSRIAEEGGLCIYAPHEGRGIGLANKIRAYALQDQGMDTVDANIHLGFSADDRDYGICAQILRHMKVNHVRLLSNNPAKQQGLNDYGISVLERLSIKTIAHEHNQNYLLVKRKKMNHDL